MKSPNFFACTCDNVYFSCQTWTCQAIFCVNKLRGPVTYGCMIFWVIGSPVKLSWKVSTFEIWSILTALVHINPEFGLVYYSKLTKRAQNPVLRFVESSFWAHSCVTICCGHFFTSPVKENRTNSHRDKVYPYFMLEQKLQPGLTYSSKYMLSLTFLVILFKKCRKLQMNIQIYKTYEIVLKEYEIFERKTTYPNGLEGLSSW